jgi:membrane protease YdiL (CAAX protease family)
VRLLIAAIRELVTGRRAYRARSSWPPLLALAAAVGVVVAAAAMASFMLTLLGMNASPPRPTPVLPGASTHIRAAALWLLSLQATIVAAVLLAAGLFGGDRGEALALAPPFPPLRIIAAALVLMLTVLLPYNIAVLLLAREILEQDLKSFIGPLSSDAGWMFALAITVGAPLSEELLFRGFLLGALWRTRLGFFGAALVTALTWTVLHAGYSGYGLIEVFLAGLFFSWLLWRTGNLWVPIVCHAVYNTLVLLVLWLVIVPTAVA